VLYRAIGLPDCFVQVLLKAPAKKIVISIYKLMLRLSVKSPVNLRFVSKDIPSLLIHHPSHLMRYFPNVTSIPSCKRNLGGGFLYEK